MKSFNEWKVGKKPDGTSHFYDIDSHDSIERIVGNLAKSANVPVKDINISEIVITYTEHDYEGCSTPIAQLFVEESDEVFQARLFVEYAHYTNNYKPKNKS